MKLFKQLSLAILIIFSANVNANELPKPPKSFSWAKCEEIKGAFLKPKGWHFKKGEKGSTQGYFITKENIDQKGSFETGLTVNVTKETSKKMNMTPHQYALKFWATAKKEHKFIEEWAKDMGPFKSLGFVYEKAEGKKKYKYHNLLIANEETGTLYLIIFEAPSKSWERAWSKGHSMLNKFLIDSEI